MRISLTTVPGDSAPLPVATSSNAKTESPGMIPVLIIDPIFSGMTFRIVSGGIRATSQLLLIMVIVHEFVEDHCKLQIDNWQSTEELPTAETADT